MDQLERLVDVVLLEQLVQMVLLEKLDQPVLLALLVRLGQQVGPGVSALLVQMVSLEQPDQLGERVRLVRLV
jgi:hypothetical protein